MRIYLNFKNKGNEYIDFVQLMLPDGKIVSLDWERSDYGDGEVIGRNVHINYEDIEDYLSEKTYGDGRIKELENATYFAAQAYNPETCKERLLDDVDFDSIVIEDSNKNLQIV